MQPGQFAPKGEDWIGRKFAELEKEIRELKAANVFGRTGIVPKDGGTDFEGFVNVNGPMTVNGTMDVTGDADFTGNMRIGGTLDLPAGIIGNDALANPLKTGSAGYTATNQSFSATPTAYGTQTIAVPDGFTQAVVLNGVSGGGTNSGAGVDFIYVAASINGAGGGETPTRADAGQYASASAFGIRTLTGLTAGSTVSVGVQIRTNSGAWAAAAANIVNVNAIVIFYR